MTNQQTPESIFDKIIPLVEKAGIWGDADLPLDARQIIRENCEGKSDFEELFIDEQHYKNYSNRKYIENQTGICVGEFFTEHGTLIVDPQQKRVIQISEKMTPFGFNDVGTILQYADPTKENYFDENKDLGGEVRKILDTFGHPAP